MYEVRLVSFPPKAAERFERVVQKHGGGKIDHDARVALLGAVARGEPQVIARYAESHCADNVIAELEVLGGRGEASKAV
jgi:hypothetical protein